MSYEPDEECPHGMGLQAWCTMCNGRDQRERKEEELRREMNRKRKWFPRKEVVPELRAGQWDRYADEDDEFDERVLVPHRWIDEFGPSHTATLEGKRRRGSV